MEERVENTRKESGIVSRVKQLFGSAYQSKVDDLRNLALLLRISRDKIKADDDAANKKAKGKELDATAWLLNAKEALEKAYKLIDEGEGAKEKHFLGLIPNLKARHDFCKKAKPKAIKLGNIEKEPKKFNEIEPQRAVVQETKGETSPGPVGGDIDKYVALPSRQLLLQKLIDALAGPDSRGRKIGLYGIEGVGKTTLAKQLYKKRDLFNAVVMVSVTWKPDFGAIRGEIASTLGIQLGDWIGSRKRAASDQGSSGSKEENILVILDDIWKPFNLKDVGIPEDDYRFRTLLISEKANKLTRMGVSTKMELEVLSEEEAQSLFFEIAGNSQISELQHMAIQVGRERCSCLPFTIVVATSFLKVGGLFREEERIRELIQYGLLNQNPEAVIFYIAKHCRSSAVMRLLLLCSMFKGPQISILDLAIYRKCLVDVYGMNDEENLIEGGVEDAIKRDVNRLLDCSLLLPGKFKGFVEMHDIVRTVVSDYGYIDIESQEVKAQRLRLVSQSQ